MWDAYLLYLLWCRKLSCEMIIDVLKCCILFAFKSLSDHLNTNRIIPNLVITTLISERLTFNEDITIYNWLPQKSTSSLFTFLTLLFLHKISLKIFWDYVCFTFCSWSYLATWPNSTWYFSYISWYFVHTFLMVPYPICLQLLLEQQSLPFSALVRCLWGFNKF